MCGKLSRTASERVESSNAAARDALVEARRWAEWRCKRRRRSVMADRHKIGDGRRRGAAKMPHLLQRCVQLPGQGRDG